MAQSGEKRGLLPQIIVGVVVALLVGGTAPWWWNEIFQKKDGKTKPPPEVVHAGQIRVRCTANPYSVPAGGQVEISVLAFTEQNTPVSGANVRIESGGGWFSASGASTEIGRTDSGGLFITRWRSPSPAASSYGMGVSVTKNGFTEGKSECNVAIQ